MILYGKEGTYDLRDLGFDKSLVNGSVSGQSDGDIPPDMQSVFAQGLSSALLGSGALGKDLSLGHQTIAAQPTDNLQEIIETLADLGGGTLKLGAYTYILDYDIEVKSGVNIVGEGRDITIIDFDGADFSMKATGTSAVSIINVRLSGFTVQNSSSTAGINFAHVDYWSFRDLRVTDCSAIGIRVNSSEYFSITDTRSDNNGTDGFDLNCPHALDETQFLVLTNCVADNNGGIGFELSLAGGGSPTSLFGCTAEDNADDGFAVSSATGRYVRFFGCNSESNGGQGFDIDADNTGLFGCYSILNTGDDINIALYGCMVVGCVTEEALVLPDSSVYAQGNFNQDITEVRNYLQAKNTSGGQLDAGHVVVLKAVASGREVTTTTTAGDDKVLGMVLGANATTSIVNNGDGQILTQGFTALLKVDGTTDIAIGDFLTCFTTAGIAAKGAAGDMCFAMALEAYTTNDSNGVIDAILFSPRLI